jgi:hypothetical protein
MHIVWSVEKWKLFARRNAEFTKTSPANLETPRFKMSSRPWKKRLLVPLHHINRSRQSGLFMTSAHNSSDSGIGGSISF